MPFLQFDNHADPPVPVFSMPIDVDCGPINVYMDILWKGMNFTKTRASVIDNFQGLIPNTGESYASFYQEHDRRSEQGKPEMTTVFRDTTITSFNLYSFFYGCEWNDVPHSCTITIAGKTPSGDDVGPQTFRFENDGQEQEMVKAVVEDFKDLLWITFDIGPEDLDTDVYGYIDSVEYEVFS